MSSGVSAFYIEIKVCALPPYKSENPLWQILYELSECCTQLFVTAIFCFYDRMPWIKKRYEIEIVLWCSALNDNSHSHVCGIVVRTPHGGTLTVWRHAIELKILNFTFKINSKPRVLTQWIFHINFHRCLFFTTRF